jgi:hypothetical protein
MELEFEDINDDINRLLSPVFMETIDGWAERDRKSHAPFAQNATPYKIT